MTPRRLAVLPAAFAALAACAHAPPPSPELAAPVGRDEASYLFARPFDETRTAALHVVRSIANAVIASTAHLEGVLPAAGAAPELRIDVWLRTEGNDRTVVLARIARPVATPIVPPGQTSAEDFLRLVADRLGVERPPHAHPPEVVAPPRALPVGRGSSLSGYGWSLGPLGAPAVRGFVSVAWDKAFRSARFEDPATHDVAYLHLAQGLRAEAGVSVPNGGGGRFDTRLAVGVESELSDRDLTWLSFPVELVETLNAGPVRAGVGVVQHLAPRAVGRGGWEGVRFDAAPGALAELGVVVPIGSFRRASAALVVTARASWVRLSAEGRRLDATSGGASLAWMF